MDPVASRIAARSLQATSSFLLPKDVARLKRLTDSNAHSDALVEGAQLLGAKFLEKKLRLVSDLQDLEGSMPKGLGEYQYRLYRDLLDYAKRTLSPEDYSLFYSAF